VKLFIDTSVLLAAAGSAKGASSYLFIHAEANGWELLSSLYCVEDVSGGANTVYFWRLQNHLP